MAPGWRTGRFRWLRTGIPVPCSGRRIRSIQRRTCRTAKEVSPRTVSTMVIISETKERHGRPRCGLTDDDRYSVGRHNHQAMFAPCEPGPMHRIEFNLFLPYPYTYRSSRASFDYSMHILASHEDPSRGPERQQLAELRGIAYYNMCLLFEEVFTMRFICVNAHPRASQILLTYIIQRLQLLPNLFAGGCEASGAG